MRLCVFARLARGRLVGHEEPHRERGRRTFRRRTSTPSVLLIREFATRIRAQVWPGKRLPEVFYDPRSLETEAQNVLGRG